MTQTPDELPAADRAFETMRSLRPYTRTSDAGADGAARAMEEIVQAQAV